jgi:hypothetical protein
MVAADGRPYNHASTSSGARPIVHSAVPVGALVEYEQVRRIIPSPIPSRFLREWPSTGDACCRIVDLHDNASPDSETEWLGIDACTEQHSGCCNPAGRRSVRVRERPATWVSDLAERGERLTETSVRSSSLSTQSVPVVFHLGQRHATVDHMC